MYRDYRCIDMDVQNDRCINIIKGNLLELAYRIDAGQPNNGYLHTGEAGNPVATQFRKPDASGAPVWHWRMPGELLVLCTSREAEIRLRCWWSRYRKSGRESGEWQSRVDKQAKLPFFWTFLIYMCHLPPSRKCQSSILQEHLLPFVSSSWEHAHKHTYPKARILVHSRSIELTLKVNCHSSFTISKQFHVLKVLCAVY